MFVRTATRRNKDGSAVRYVQLVQNEWDPATKSSRMRVVHSFGREDQLDRAAVGRLAGSLGRLLGQEPAGAAPELAYAGSVAYGGTYAAGPAVAAAGHRPGHDRDCSGGTRRDAATERVLFALVANRALAPSSKLAAAALGEPQGAISTGCPPPPTTRATGRWTGCTQVRGPWRSRSSARSRRPLDLEVDLLFFDYPANRARDLVLAA